MTKLLIIVGPTSSGKSELAVKLAKKFNGEIISCDSRQIYKGMDLGTGKISGRWKKVSTGLNHGRDFNQFFIYKGVAHHCIDFINPKQQYSAALFQRSAKKAVDDIIARGKLPILCGGTAHWMDAVVYNQKIPDVKPNLKLRKRLEKQSADSLFKRLMKLDPRRAANIDSKNKHRLIRALEIVIITGKPVPANGIIHSASSGQALRSAVDEGFHTSLRDSSASDVPRSGIPLRGTLGLRMTPYDALWLGIKPADDILTAKIKKRLAQRLKAGMVKEVQHLHSPLPLGEGSGVRVRSVGLSWKKLESFGLEYKFISLYLQKKLSYDEMFGLLFTAIKQYSKRQMTWWKRNKNIHWIQKPETANRLVKIFLTK